MSNHARPEPEDIVSVIRGGLKWGPVNSQVAVNAGFCCEYCGLDMLKNLEAYYSWQIDQVIPGSGYTVESCALSCRTCNHLKHNRKPEGSSRAEWIDDARQDINIKRSRRLEELEQLRAIVGYKGVVAGA